MKVFSVMPGVCFSHGLRFLFELESMARGLCRLTNDVRFPLRVADRLIQVLAFAPILPYHLRLVSRFWEIPTVEPERVEL
jgi:hypothetical protein